MIERTSGNENPVLEYGNDAVQVPVNDVVQKPSDTALGYGNSVLVAQAPKPTAKKKQPVPQLKKAATIMISDGTESDNFKKFMGLFASHTVKIQSSSLLFVNSWEELVKKLQEYEHIEKLVLFTHGIPGGIGIGHEFEDLGVVANRFKGQPTPKIKEIDFEGCNIGDFSEESNVDGLVNFVDTFGTTKFSAWNKFHVDAPSDLIIPNGTTVQQIEGTLAKYKDYLIPGTPTPAEFLSKGGTQYFGLEWFRTDFNDEPLPDDANKRRNYKKRQQAQIQSIKGTVKEVNQKLKIQWKTYKDNPEPPFQKLVIEITR